MTLQQNHADVSFSVDTSQHLTTTTLAAIHFENLLGQRFLAILPGATGGKPLPPGGVIPLAHTTPAIDLTAVFDGFQPLFSALSPDQVNQLAGSIIDVFQGESGTVSNIVAADGDVDQQPGRPPAGDRHPPHQPVEPAQHGRGPRHPAGSADRELRHA